MDLEKTVKELEKSGKADKLKAMASSSDAKKLNSMLDAKAVEAAVRSGDGNAMQEILRQVLGTEEGRNLARRITDAMK